MEIPFDADERSRARMRCQSAGEFAASRRARARARLESTPEDESMVAHGDDPRDIEQCRSHRSWLRSWTLMLASFALQHAAWSQCDEWSERFAPPGVVRS